MTTQLVLLKDRRRTSFGDSAPRSTMRTEVGICQLHALGFFRHGELPTIREVIKFLEVYQMKDISVVNLKALGRASQEHYGIVCSGFSIKHLYNTAKLLCQEVKKLECP